MSFGTLQLMLFVGLSAVIFSANVIFNNFLFVHAYLRL